MEHRGADEHASKPADVCRLYFIYYQKKKETLQKTKTIVAEWGGFVQATEATEIFGQLILEFCIWESKIGITFANAQGRDVWMCTGTHGFLEGMSQDSPE